MPLFSDNPPLYKSHPLYRFRRTIIVNALIGVPLTILASISGTTYPLSLWLLGDGLLLVSALIAFADLCIWTRHRRKEQPARSNRESNEDMCRACSARLCADSDRQTAARTVHDQVLTVGAVGNGSGGFKWPVRWIMVVDFLLAGVLFWLLISEILEIPFIYYGTSFSQLCMHYATVPMGYSSVLHARCWWRGFRARERESWARGLGLMCSESRHRDDIEADDARDINEHDIRIETGRFHQSVPSVPASVIRTTVQELNRQARKELSSKIWPPGTTDSAERQALLSHERKRKACTDNTRYHEERCLCSYAHTSHPATRSGPDACSGSHILIKSHRAVEATGTTTNTRSAEETVFESCAADLTLNDTTRMDLSRSTMSDFGWKRAQRNRPSNSRTAGTSVSEDDCASSNSAVQAREASVSHDEVDDTSEPDITFIKKARSTKTKVFKGKDAEK